MMEPCTRASSTSDGLERDPGLRIPIHQHSSSAEEIIDKYVSIVLFSREIVPIQLMPYQ